MSDIPARDTYPAPPHGWTCFHCGETFMHPNAARLHFGASITDEPKCQISAHRLRAMEDELRRYRDEDTDLHRQLRSMETDHAVALRREEEKGYARGLRDARAESRSIAAEAAWKERQGEDYGSF
jgi:hypothetical protein